MEADDRVKALAMAAKARYLQTYRTEFARRDDEASPLTATTMNGAQTIFKTASNGSAIRRVPWIFEVAILTHRAFLNLWRNPVLLRSVPVPTHTSSHRTEHTQ